MRICKDFRVIHKSVLWMVHSYYLISLLCGHELEFIQDIVKMILNKLSYAFLKGTKGLVGIDSRVEELLPLLAIGSNDVCIIGVWGMGENWKDNSC